MENWYLDQVGSEREDSFGLSRGGDPRNMAVAMAPQIRLNAFGAMKMSNKVSIQMDENDGGMVQNVLGDVPKIRKVTL